MENYNNLIQAGILMAQTVQELRVGSSHQVKNHDQLRCLLKANGMWNRSRNKVVINSSYEHLTSYRHKDFNCHEYFLLTLS